MLLHDPMGSKATLQVHTTEADMEKTKEQVLKKMQDAAEDIVERMQTNPEHKK